MYRLFIAALLLAAVTALPIRAAEDPRQLSARIAINLFAKTCLANMGDPAKAAKVATGELSMAEMPADLSAPFLVGRPGRAYSAASQAGGFVLSLPDEGGVCLVYAQIADPVEVGTRFQSVMADLCEDTFEMRQTGQGETDGRISRAWDLVPTGSHLKKLRAKFGKRDFPPLFEVGLTTAPAGGLFEAVLSTASKAVPKR